MCCLIHCGNGYNRSLTLLTAYVMDRFKWRLLKAIDFLQSKGVTIMLTESNI
jgi:protein-tyrosine phosphatase